MIKRGDISLNTPDVEGRVTKEASEQENISRLDDDTTKKLIKASELTESSQKEEN